VLNLKWVHGDLASGAEIRNISRALSYCLDAPSRATVEVMTSPCLTSHWWSNVRWS